METNFFNRELYVDFGLCVYICAQDKIDVWDLRLNGLRDAPAPRFRKSAHKLYQHECHATSTRTTI